MERCQTCGGALVSGDGGPACINCGRPGQGEAERDRPRGLRSGGEGSEDGAILFTLELRFRSLSELLKAYIRVVGRARAAEAMDILPNQLDRVSTFRSVVYVKVLLFLVKELGVTPSDLVRLLEGEIRRPAELTAGKRRARRAMKDAVHKARAS